MPTVREVFRDAGKIAGKRVGEAPKRLNTPPCVFAVEEGRASCCGASFRCTHANSQQYGKLGTGTRCGRCEEKEVLGHYICSAEAASDAQGPSRGILRDARIGVILPARQEGDWVRKTIWNFHHSKLSGTKLDFAVIDDASTDGSCGELIMPQGSWVELWCNDKVKGQVANRTRGMEMLPDMDVYVSIDAHMEIEPEGGLERLAWAAVATQGLVGCLSAALNTGKNFRGAGHVWKPHDGKEGFANIRSTWAYQRAKVLPLLMKTELLAGACYAFTRETYEKLGGFHETFGPYGMFERDLSINAYFQNIPILVRTDVVAWHFYRRNRPYPHTGLGRLRGYVECLRQMFRRDMWEKHFLPDALEMQATHKDDIVEALLYHGELQLAQAEYQKKKVRTDEQVLKWMRLL